jgi:tRNA(adenine34) deaminase
MPMSDCRTSFEPMTRKLRDSVTALHVSHMRATLYDHDVERQSRGSFHLDSLSLQSCFTVVLKNCRPQRASCRDGLEMALSLCRLLLFCGLTGFLSAWNWSPIVHFLSRRRISFAADLSDDGIDSYFMSLAMKEANHAGARHKEVPIGAVVVRRHAAHFEILSRASNRVEKMHDASAHAELLALQGAGRMLKNWRLINTTLYSTLEPCPMCLSASLNFRVSRIVYAAPDHRLGAIETLPNSLIEQHPFHSIDDIRAGVLQNESTSLLKNFFRQRRRAKNK